MAEKKPKKRAEQYEEKVKTEGTFNELMGKLFPKVKPNKSEPLPKLKGGNLGKLLMYSGYDYLNLEKYRIFLKSLI